MGGNRTFVEFVTFLDTNSHWTHVTGTGLRCQRFLFKCRRHAYPLRRSSNLRVLTRRGLRVRLQRLICKWKRF